MKAILIYPGEDGYFVAEVPSLPGCISQGKTHEEVLINIQEAIELYLNVLSEKGRSSSNRSLLELAGLGAKIWNDVDVEDYINQLRDEWDNGNS